MRSLGHRSRAGLIVLSLPSARPRRWDRIAAATSFLLIPTAISFWSAEVAAKTTFASPYTLAQTYNAALRLVRVDLGLTVTERDPAVAYILFDYKSAETGQRAVRGSIEMLDAGRNVKVIVQLAQMPHYHEQIISDTLSKKLRDEYGEPSTRKPDAPDGGAEPTPPSGD